MKESLPTDFPSTQKSMEVPNKALHQTAIPLRSIAAGELCR